MGSIPAPAGEPLQWLCYSSKRRVYPRACGGTSISARSPASCTGLSPRLRGNPVCVLFDAHGRGSIPAPAGEPGPATARTALPWVYPRACGGTSGVAVSPMRRAGLSPRLRGNRRGRGTHRPKRGSIPAPAGEPQGHHLPDAQQQVHPRACGGTGQASASVSITCGLSPRLRGNHRYEA